MEKQHSNQWRTTTKLIILTINTLRTTKDNINVNTIRILVRKTKWKENSEQEKNKTWK